MLKDVFEKLDFYKLLQLISERLHCPKSVEILLGFRPLKDINEIEIRGRQIEEIRRCHHTGFAVSLNKFSDITPLIKKVSPEGSILDAKELFCFIDVLENISSVTTLIDSHSELRYLKIIRQSLTSFDSLLFTLKRSVNPEGEILDTASPTLRDIRQNIRRLESKIRKKLEEIVQSKEVSIFLQDTFITQRSGRWVIPVRMDSKGQVSGVVHDVSNSGETAFIEPLSVIHLTNELENLKADEKAEEIRILREISNKIRANSTDLLESFEALTYFDVLNGIALFSNYMSMELPLVSEVEEIKIFNARHPLLFDNLEKRGEGAKVVPLDLTLNKSTPILIITGPNAGGKTILIKTVGLLTIMALCGMPVPASSMSHFPLFDEIMADIGDEQSIENNLSTFAGHISNLSRFIKHAKDKTLILIDELGTGTDPIEGSALASAVLMKLKETGAMVIANTHLSEIKSFVYKTEGMINGSMEFDTQNYKPLYRFTIGLPGQSFAFETAMQYGLSKEVVDYARELLGKQKIEIDNLIKELHEKKNHYEALITEINLQQKTLQEERDKLKTLLKEAEEEKRKILLDAYSDAQNIIYDAKSQISHLLHEAEKKSKSELKQDLKKISTIITDLDTKTKNLKPKEEFKVVGIDDINIGDKVFSRSLNSIGRISAISEKHKRVKLFVEGLEYDVALDDILVAKTDRDVKPKETIYNTSNEETTHIVLNLIGKRVDDALSEVEPFLNHAFLSGISTVTIIHGIGTGALKNAIRQYLKGHNLVKGIRQGEKAEGGAGVTIVELR
ncbi:MAG: endonuclease MutS2 [Thermodesulfovibrionales bacterium]|nr:endonuclease MutS2 [Thermodesulfovibrionales bacterium]